MLISLLLVSDALLRNLLVVHGILSLIDGVRPTYLLHCRFSPLLAQVELDLRYVLDSGFHKLLVECGRRRQRLIDFLTQSRYDTQEY